MAKIEQLKAKIAGLSPSDQRALGGLSAFLLVVVIYLVVSASFEFRNQRLEAFNEGRLLVHWVKLNAKPAKVASWSKKKTVQTTGEQSLLTLASDSAKKNALSFKRFQPEGDKALKIWMEDANFNKMLLWLHGLEHTYGIKPEKISVDRQESPGLVDVTMTLSLP